MVPRVFTAVVAAALGFAACADVTQMFGPLPSGAGGDGSGGGVGGSGGAPSLGIGGGPQGPPSADAGGLCGNEIHAITSKPTNVYFIFDISGSMSTPVQGGTRYSLVQSDRKSVV